MNQCEPLVRDASGGVAAALRAVDCMSADATASAFGRLFGTNGALLPALTLLLTLYIGFFAISLLTGRSRIGISALTPRMLLLGLILTFATSWAAYQGVVWNIATGAPDQIAGVIMGAQGSATQIFANRIDILFNAIAETAQQASQNGQAVQGAPAPAAQGSFAPANLMWLGALLFMLGTVGLLVTARIALAVLLAVGPVFITLALFGGTRGLFAGWLRGVILTAITPLFAVLGGGFMVELAVPVVISLRGAEGIDGRAAMALFVISAVHCALMALGIRVASTMVAGWRVFGIAESGGSDRDRSAVQTSNIAMTAAAGAPALAASAARTRTLTTMVPALALAGPAGAPQAGSAPGQGGRTIVIPAAAHGTTRPAPIRANGVGSRFARRTTSQEFLR